MPRTVQWLQTILPYHNTRNAFEIFQMEQERNFLALREAARKILVGLSNEFERLFTKFTYVDGEVRKMLSVSRRAIYESDIDRFDIDILNTL